MTNTQIWLDQTVPINQRTNILELASVRTCIITECRMANIPTQLDVVIN